MKNPSENTIQEEPEDIPPPWSHCEEKKGGVMAPPRSSSRRTMLIILKCMVVMGGIIGLVFLMLHRGKFGNRFGAGVYKVQKNKIDKQREWLWSPPPALRQQQYRRGSSGTICEEA